MPRGSARTRSLLPYLSVLPLILLTGCPVEEDDYVAPWPQVVVDAPDHDESGPAGPARQKAEAYDAWHLQWHQPDYGGTVTVRFTDGTWTDLDAITEWGDSTIWTGSYLASQAWRYHVTGDPQARANAIRSVEALSGALHVTGREGYIARYWGSQDGPIYQGDTWCANQDRCYAVEEGPYAGDFWWGSTSRDQYTGWILGMTLAYDLIDDAATRALIQADVLEVIGTLVANDWTIIDQDGEPTGTAPQVLPNAQLPWALMGYHVTGDADILADLKRQLLNSNRGAIRIASINFLNQYGQYYGNNLSHTNAYNLLRLAKHYLSADDYAFVVEHFNEADHGFTRLSHNAWFNAIYMSHGGWTSEGAADPYAAQLAQDLGDFRPAPNARYALPARDPGSYTVDPTSVQLATFSEMYPELSDLIGFDFDEQALEAFPVLEQCSTDFLWQRNPFRIDACGSEDARWVNPGVDYLVAYWVARYEKLIDRSL